MKPYTHILFDLDGTITDPAEGITTCVRHALHCQGIEEENYQNLCRMIGPPLAEGFRDFYDMDEEHAWQAVRDFRELFARIGVEKNIPYPGMKEALLRLRDAGKVLCVATSKPEPFARAIADRFGLAECFDFVGGASLDDTRTKKAAVIEYVLASVGSPKPEQVLMVGDRRHDVEGAAAFGLACVGVLYGYASREELTAAGACFLAEQPADIADYVRGK